MDDALAIREVARQQFFLQLQLAYSGELGAAAAYLGHAHALRGTPFEAPIRCIARDEVEHRHCILAMLRANGYSPAPHRERKLAFIGFCISVFCHVGGWFFPMYGAAKLEAQNIFEYELAAQLASLSGLEHYVDALLHMAEIEWDHELYFRTHAESHWLWKLVPHWPVPSPRAEIRQRFEAFAARPKPNILKPLKIPLLIR
jgi:hypothetical protein